MSVLSLINGKTARESITLDFAERRLRSLSGTVKEDEVATTSPDGEPEGNIFVPTESLSRCGSLIKVG